MSSEKSPLRQLADIISASVDAIDARFAKDGLTYPSLNEPSNPTSPAEGLAMNPELMKNIMGVVSACGQLTATINVPFITLVEQVMGVSLAAALRTVAEINVPEILREHPDGLHVKDIAEKSKSGIDSGKLARLLRALSTSYIFLEVAPDTFKNNRLSSLIDTGKSVSEILANPDEKYTGSNGLSALTSHAEETFKGASYLTETLLDPKTALSDAQEDTTVARAYGFNKSVWEWWEEPGNEFRLKRFAVVASSMARTHSSKIVLGGLKWQDLAPGSRVVDVGAGLGQHTLTIRKEAPQLKFVVQDRDGIMSEARKYWETNAPDALEKGDVILQGHDFFQPQPEGQTAPDVYFLSMILHDYGRTPALRILKHLRDASSPKTKLVVLDQVLPYACPPHTVTPNNDIPGADALQPRVPSPLHPNMGKASLMGYLADLLMLIGLNGEARTLPGYIELFRAAGWKIERVYPVLGALQTQIVATPV